MMPRPDPKNLPTQIELEKLWDLMVMEDRKGHHTHDNLYEATRLVRNRLMTTEESNVAILGFQANNSFMVEPLQVIEDVKKELKDKNSEIYGAKKLVVLIVDDENGYGIRFRQCQMKSSQLIAMCEIFKADVLKLMGY
jgi:hypothetical protein